jgi:hypothetical protein
VESESPSLPTTALGRPPWRDRVAWAQTIGRTRPSTRTAESTRHLFEEAGRRESDHQADDEGSTLREAALALGVSAADFDRIVDPKTMVGDPRHDLGLER